MPIKTSDIINSNEVVKAFDQITDAVELSQKAVNELIAEGKELSKALGGANLADVTKAQKTYNTLVKDSQTIENNTIKILQNKEKLEQQAVRTTEQKKKALIAEEKLKQSKLRTEQQLLAAEKKRAKEEQAELNRQAKLNSRYAQTSKRLIDLRNKAKDVALTYGTTSKRFKVLQREALKLDSSLKKIDSSLGQNQRNVGNYTKGLGSLKGAFMGVAGALGFVGGIQLFAKAIKDGVRITKQFEKQNAVLASVLGKTRKETVALQKESQRLGANTAFTATEVVDLQIELARLGKTEEEIIASTEGIIDATIALGSETGETAALVGATLNAFNLGANESSKVADILTLSTQRSALSFDKLNTALPIVGGAAAAAGVKLETVVAQLGKAADRGIDASTAATSLRNIYIELASKGLTLEEALGRINGAQDGLTEATDLFGKRAAVTALALAGNIDKTNELSIALENAGGTAKRVAEEQLNTLDGALKLAQSAYEGLLLTLGKTDGAIKFVNGLTAAITNLTESFKGAEGIGEELGEGILNNIAKNSKTTEEAIKRVNKAISGQIESIESLRSETEGLDILDKVGAALTGGLSVQDKVNDLNLLAEQERKTAETIKVLKAELAILERKAALERIDLSNKTTEELIRLEGNYNQVFNLLTDEQKIKLEAIRLELKKRNEIIKEGAGTVVESVDEEIAAFEKLESKLVQQKDLASEIAEAFIKGDKEIIASSLERSNRIIDDAKRASDITKEQEMLKRELAIESFYTFADLGNALVERRIAEFDQQIEANNDFFNKRLENEALDDETRQALEDQRDQKNRELEAKRRKEQKKQAAINKGVALFNIALNTAQGISKTIATLGLPLAIPFVVATAALGALQAATVLAQPVPQFAEGTDNAPKGLAVVGEEGTERVQEKSGKTWFTPNKPTLVKLKGGEKISPADETAQMMRDELAREAMMMNVYGEGLSTRKMEDSLDRQNMYSKKIYNELKRGRNNASNNIGNTNGQSDWYNKKIGR